MMSNTKRISIAIMILFLSSAGIYYSATTLVEVQKTTSSFQDAEVLLAGGIILLSLLCMVSFLHLFTYYTDQKTGKTVFIVAYQNYVNYYAFQAEVAGLVLGIISSVLWWFIKDYFDIGIVIGVVVIIFIFITFGMIINLTDLKKKRIFKNIQQYFDTVLRQS